MRVFRRDGLPPALLDAWIDVVGWEALLNRKGTTWRQLGPAQRDASAMRRRPGA